MVHPRHTRPHRAHVVRRASLVLGTLVLLLPAPEIARAQAPAPDAVPTTGWRPRIVRSGTVTLHGGALYGTLLGGGPYSETFDQGIGLGFALRYRNSQESSLGLGF